MITKQLLWERRLLDLSLRNNLLNIRITKNTLQLIPANLSCLEDALADGEEFRILHRPADWESPAMDFGIYSSIPESDPMVGFINSELSQKRLRFYLPENDLGKALTHLYRSSRTSIEENGANTLYLALGLLKWYETPSSERPRYAPILLLPVEIIRKSAAKGYVIRSREEETMMNITLLEMLRQNFGITISGLDPLPTDESGVNVKLIYSIIRNSIKNQRKWDVEEQAILGIFSFNKFIMWNDIHNNAQQTGSEQNCLQPHQRKDRMGSRHGGDGCHRLWTDKLSPGRHCIAHHRRFVSAGSNLRGRTRQDFYPARPSGNRKVPDDHQHHRQRALQRETRIVCSRKDGSPLRCPKQAGSHRTCPVLSGNSLQQDEEVRRYLATESNYVKSSGKRAPEEFGKEAERLLTVTGGTQSSISKPCTRNILSDFRCMMLSSITSP